ncbi:hypothetical protein C0989_001337 [Termitomyces sp. Mn162]|nr:hypothetical protein C0989_001337 [Termitomyces sp. Mn162]
MLEECSEDRRHITEIEEHSFFAGMFVTNMPLASYPLKSDEFVPGLPLYDLGPYPDLEWAPGLQELDEVELVDVRFKEAGVKARKLKEAVEVAVKDERCEIGVVVEDCEMVEEECEVRVKEIVVEEEKTSVVRALFQRLWPWLKKR